MALVPEVTIATDTGTYDIESGQWRAQVTELHASLRDEVGTISLRSAPAPDAKGTLETVILALGSSGALLAAEHCFRAWLGRDKTRSLTVTWTDDTGKERKLSITGERLDRRSFKAFTESIGRMLEDR